MDCLRLQGHNEIEFEPDGNIPPDILMYGRIAIEVRRLNQNISVGNDFEGLEEVEYPVHKVVTGILDSYTSVESEISVLISYHFRRPLPPLKDLKRGILETLRKHEPQIYQRMKYSIGNNFELYFWPLSERMEKTFVYAASLDKDSGGFIVNQIYTNLKLVAIEKDNKIQSHKSKYPEWWLALVDNIGYLMNAHDMQQFYELPKIASSFDKILMVSPIDPNKWIFLYE